MEKLDAQTILDAGAAIATVQFGETQIPYAVVPEGYSLESAENLLDYPARKRAKVTMLDAESYINMGDGSSTGKVLREHEAKKQLDDLVDAVELLKELRK